MMKVCFDYQIFWLQKQGGISRYFCELAAHLQALPGCTPCIVAPFHGNDNLRKVEKYSYAHVLNPVIRKIFYNRLWDKKIAVNETLARWELGNKNSILHETYYTHRFPCRRPRVTTVHDMIYEKFHRALPDEMEIIAAKKKAITGADAVIAVSQSTMNDIVDIYPEVRQRISVVHHGVKLPAPGATRPVERPFLLYVGNRGWYKNFEVLLRAYAGDRDIHSQVDLCCFGGEPQTEEEKRTIADVSLAGRVHFLRGDDKMLATLYSTAAALVYTSSYEGFGLPVLEAMSLGCPVICSNTSSLPEVAGTAAIFVSPGNVAELSGALHKVLEEAEKERLAAAGLIQSKKFTWERCARETFKVYEKLL